MRVAVAYETGQPLVLEDLPVPAIGPRDVLVRVTASGICHTDLNVISGLSALPLPIVPGHEGCGIVEETGPEVGRVRPGDRVLAAVCGCGTFAEAMVVHEASVVPVRTDLGDAELALLGCGVTTGLGAALNTAAVTPGSSVAVIGRRVLRQAAGRLGGRRSPDPARLPRFIRLAEAGLLDLGSMISHRIKLEEINDGIALLTRSEGTRTVVL